LRETKINIRGAFVMEMIPKNNEKFNDFEEKTWKN